MGSRRRRISLHLEEMHFPQLLEHLVEVVGGSGAPVEAVTEEDLHGETGGGPVDDLRVFPRRLVVGDERGEAGTFFAHPSTVLA